MEQVRANWATIVAAVNALSKVSGALLANSAPVSVHDGVLAVAFANKGVLANVGTGAHLERITGAVADAVGTQLRIDPVLDPGAASRAPATADVVDSGDADPDDEALISRSAMDMVTEALGGKLIGETTRE